MFPRCPFSSSLAWALDKTGPSARETTSLPSPIAFPAYFLEILIGAQLRRDDRKERSVVPCARRVRKGEG